jgi:hypothetical protein
VAANLDSSSALSGVRTKRPGDGHTRRVPAPSLDEWIKLIQGFVDGALPGDQFDEAYFALYARANEASDRGDPTLLGASARQVDEAKWILDDFFVEVDCLSNDPETFPEIAITEDELRTTARRVVSQLQQVRAGTSPHPGPLGSVLRLALVSILLVAQAAVFAVYVVWRAVLWPFARIAERLRRS